MPHVILAAQAYLQRQLVEEPVTVRDIDRVVLRQTVHLRIVGVQLIDHTAVLTFVMCVRRTVAPVARVVVSGFQTTLRRRFPFVIGLDLDTLLLTRAVLVLPGRVRALNLRVIGQHVKTEVIIRTAYVQLVFV